MTPEPVAIRAAPRAPRRVLGLPQQVWDEESRADAVVEPGEWIDDAPLAELQRSPGSSSADDSNDNGGRCEELREDARVSFGGVDPSHIPWGTTESGRRLLIPGSPTDRRRQPHCTYMTAVAEDGELRDVHLHRLPPRRPAR